MFIQRAAMGGVTLGLTCIAPAQVIEGFEHGNESLYLQVTPGDNMDLVQSAAHDGEYGAAFAYGLSGWRSRSLSTSPGTRYVAHVRVRGSSPVAGRLYMAVATFGNGAWSAVFAPNTGDIQLQDNSAWSFITVASAPVAIGNDTWYALVLDWAAGGAMTVSLMDDAMGTTFASTPPYETGQTLPGGFAIRGFSMDPATFLDLDTFATPVAACYPDCNKDEALNLSDFGCFTTRFALGDPYADCNGDQSLNLSDFGCFMTRFALGCP